MFWGNLFHNKIPNVDFGTWKRRAAITNPKNVGVALEVTVARHWKDFGRVSVNVACAL